MRRTVLSDLLAERPPRRTVVTATITVSLLGVLVAWWGVSCLPREDGSGARHSAPGWHATPRASGSAAPAASAAGTGPAAPGSSGGPGNSPASLPPGATPANGPSRDSAEAGFLTEVGAIDPALAADPDRALVAGRATCADLAAHKPDEELIRATGVRFKLGTASPEQVKASLLVDAARNHLCPG